MVNARPEIDLLDVNVWLAHATDALLEGWLSDTNGFSTLQWTDAHLASIASAFGCRLVSFDGGYRKFQPLNFLHLSA